MKKKALLLILFLVWMLCLTACGSSTDSSQKTDAADQEEQVDSETEEQDEASEPDQDEPDQEELDIEEDTTDQALADVPVNITIYYSNDDATAFDSEEVQIDSLSPEEVLNALAEKGVMAADVQVLSCKTATVDEKATIELDFNSEFASYVSGMGSTGEYYVMGSVCNTFLSAYDCEQIKITVEGETLTTGHTEYPGYMTKFS